MNRLFRFLLISVYLLPMLVGHGGMHVLLGVEHRCCIPAVPTSTGHPGCCGHNHCHSPVRAAENSPDQADSSPGRSSVPLIPAEESDCFLCQDMRLAQLQAPTIQLLATGERVELLIPAIPHNPLLEIVGECAPRGPPSGC